MTPDELAGLHKAAFTRSRPWSAEEFAALLDTAGTFALGDARAFALGRVVADEAELLTLAAHPDHRRQGHARRLMDEVHTEAARRGATRVFLEVAADNAPALALYRGCGYAVTGRRPRYYSRPGGAAADALHMARQI